MRFSVDRPGSATGSEFLSDGWLWPERDGPSAARSVGRESEIVFVIHDEPVDTGDIEIELANIELEDGSRCTHVNVQLDGVDLAPIDVGTSFGWISIRSGVQAPGFHRLILRPNRYGVSKSSAPWRENGWRMIRENALTAFDARGFRLGGVNRSCPAPRRARR